MLRLLFDQIDRNRWLLGAAVLAATLAALLAPEPPASDATDFGRIFLSQFIATFPAFLAASMGYHGLAAEPRGGGGRAIRILPLRPREAARALWLGAAVPGCIVGAAVCAAVMIVETASLLVVQNPSSGRYALLVPVLLASILGSAMSVVMWSYLVVTGRWPALLIMPIGVVAFHQSSYLVWLTAAAWDGPLGPLSLLIVALAVAAAGACMLVSSRLWTRWSLRPARVADAGVGAATVVRRTQTRISDLLTPLPAVAAGFGAAFVLGAGLHAATALYQPLERFLPLPFRVRWMVLATYAVAWFGFASWRPALRAFRCLPLSGGRLTSLSIGLGFLIHLAGAAGAAAALALEGARSALAELPFLAVLGFGAWLCLAGLAVHVRGRNSHHVFGFGFIALPIAFFHPISTGGAVWRAGFAWRVWLWSYAIPLAVVLTALGVLALSYGLTRGSSPYRVSPLERDGEAV